VWVTPDGAQHVLSLPDPAEVLTPAALVSFLGLCLATPADDLDLALVDRLLALHDDGFEPDPDGRFVDRAPDLGLVDGDVSTLAALDTALARIDPRWQVDVLLALQDLLHQYAAEAGGT
jgi:hypothetical protein